jgi:hypothetical protein
MSSGFDRGDTIWYFTNDTGWRTGVFLRAVERGRKSGMFVVRRTADNKEILVKPDDVHEMNGTVERQEITGKVSRGRS